jgi:hypothetical protein
MIILEDIVPQHFQNEIEQTILGESFPWYYNKDTAEIDNKYACTVDEKTRDVTQFVHSFKSTNTVSNYFSLVTPFLVILESKFNRSFADRVIRIKTNLIPRHSNFPEDFYNAPHTDWGSVDPETKSETLLYYVNDSDGDTFIFNEKPPSNGLTIKHRISPKKGRAILFESDHLHAGQPPRFADERCVINFVFRR